MSRVPSELGSHGDPELLPDAHALEKPGDGAMGSRTYFEDALAYSVVQITELTKRLDEEKSLRTQSVVQMTELTKSLDEETTSRKQLIESMAQMTTQLVQQMSQASAQEATDSSAHASLLANMRKRHSLELEQLRKELSKRIELNTKLHSMVQATQAATDLSDQDVDSRFGHLRFQISQFAGNHFGSFKVPHDGLKSFRNMKQTDHQVFLESTIADSLETGIFQLQWFGLDGDTEQTQINLENGLKQRKAPPADIVAWRTETVKVFKLLKTSDQRPKIVFDLATREHNSLKNWVTYKDVGAALADMKKLYAAAYDLALMLRGSKIDFRWQQEMPEGVDHDEFDFHAGYAEYNEKRGCSQRRVLFGPVYKYTGGLPRIVVRKGEMLVSKVRPTTTTNTTDASADRGVTGSAD